MTTQATVKKEVEKIKQRILPPKDLVIIMSCGLREASHGKYGYRKIHAFTGETEPLEPERELEMMREHYEELPKHAKRRHKGNFPSCSWDYDWSTFEGYLKHHECKCGREHPYHNPEYRQQNKWRKT